MASPEFKQYIGNQNVIGDLQQDISRTMNTNLKGSFNSNQLNDTINAFSEWKLSNPNGTIDDFFKTDAFKSFSDSFKDNGDAFNKIKGDFAEIINKSTENQGLQGRLNTFEKAFTTIGTLGQQIPEAIGNQLNAWNIPVVGEFIKSAGSFNPLTGFNIGASAGADPAKGVAGFGKFFLSMPENMLGLREGSLFEHFSSGDFNPVNIWQTEQHGNYWNPGKGLGSAFIIYAGAKELKTDAAAAGRGLTNFARTIGVSERVISGATVGVNLVKSWGPTALLGGAAVYSIFSGNGSLGSKIGMSALSLGLAYGLPMGIGLLKAKLFEDKLPGNTKFGTADIKLTDEMISEIRSQFEANGRPSNGKTMLVFDLAKNAKGGHDYLGMFSRESLPADMAGKPLAFLTIDKGFEGQLPKLQAGNVLETAMGVKLSTNMADFIRENGQRSSMDRLLRRAMPTMEIKDGNPGGSVASSKPITEFLITPQMRQAQAGDIVLLLPKTEFLKPVTGPTTNVEQIKADLSNFKTINDTIKGQKLSTVGEISDALTRAGVTMDRRVIEDFVSYRSGFGGSFGGVFKQINDVVMDPAITSPFQVRDALAQKGIQIDRATLRDYYAFRKQMGTSFIQSIDLMGREGAQISTGEAHGFMMMKALAVLETGGKIEANSELKPYESLARAQILNNQIMTFKGESPLEHNMAQLGFGYRLAESYFQYKAGQEVKVAFDLGCGAGKTEQTAIVVRYLSELYKHDKLKFNTSTTDLVREFEAKPLMWGARVNEIDAKKGLGFLNLRNPFREGINVFDNHTLLSLGRDRSFNPLHFNPKRSPLENTFLFLDEPQAGMQAADLVTGRESRLAFLTRAASRIEHQTRFESLRAIDDMMVDGLITRLDGVKAGDITAEMRTGMRDRLMTGELRDQLISKGIVIREDNSGNFKLSGEFRDQLQAQYTEMRDKSPKKFTDFKTDLPTVLDTLGKINTFREGQEYYLENAKIGEYSIAENYRGNPLPNTHFGSRGEGVLSNLDAQLLAIKHGWDFDAFQHTLLTKNDFASNYVGAISKARGIVGMSGTAINYEAGLNAALRSRGAAETVVERIGSKFDAQVRRNTDVLMLKGESDLAPIADAIVKSRTESRLIVVSGGSRDQLVKLSGMVESRIRMAEPSFDAARSMSLIAYEDIRANNFTEMQARLNDTPGLRGEFVTRLREDRGGNLLQRMKDPVAAVKTEQQAEAFINSHPELAVEKFNKYFSSGDYKIERFQSKLSDFKRQRENSPTEQKIVFVQGLIEGVNIAKKVGGNTKMDTAHMFLIGMHPEANVIQAAERVGVDEISALRRIPGKFTWAVSETDRYLTDTQASDLRRYSEAGNKGKVREILFETSQDIQTQINAQNISKVMATERVKMDGGFNAGRSISNLSRAFRWDFQRYNPSGVKISTAVSQVTGTTAAIKAANQQQALAALAPYRVTLDTMTKEGTALYGLAVELMGMNSHDRMMLRQAVSGIKGLEIAEDMSFAQAFKTAQSTITTQRVFS